MAKRRSHRGNTGMGGNESAVTEPTEQAAQPAEIVRANINRQVVMAPTFASIYANDVQVQTTPWDIRLIFGEIFHAPSETDPNVVVRQLGELRMSPQLTKKVLEILRHQLDVYEKSFGKIPQPRE